MRSPVHVAPATTDLVRDLASHDHAAAVVTADEQLTYRELAARVDDVARRLGGGRRLVLLAARNDIDSLVAYLGALSAGHPVLLAPGQNAMSVASLTTAYDPDVVVSGAEIAHRRDGSAHQLHPELAVLMSTSGSTGSPKLVRLSHRNLQANAESIAQYLDIRSSDRAATTLPMAYCYGLSVINSHLLRGAALLLTGLSVVDTCFWRLFREQRGTTLAGVPHTFELLDRVGFAEMDLPHLRYVTQAGGRLAPDRVRRFDELGQRRGWDLVVMYGQTEATARMAYLPPHLTSEHPSAIGIAIPGGSLSLRPVVEHDDPDVGELVYSGPNVMLGYAERPGDLALGRVTDVLPTGDLARRTPEGLFELVGRRSRFVKVYGLRIDLQRVENVFAGLGIAVCCTGDDDTLVVAVEGGHDPGIVRRLAATELGLPVGAVRVCPLGTIPRLENGKPDHAAVISATRPSEPTKTPPNAKTRPASPTTDAVDTDALRLMYAELLDRPGVTDDDTFVSLGGDSLSYVAASIRLEEMLGHLPTGWHTTPVRDLVPVARETRRRGHVVETSVALRAVAIVLIVSTHAQLFDIRGSAHVLMAVAGYNFARFQLTGSTRGKRVGRQLTSIARIVVPSVLWIGAAYLLTDRYGPENVALLNVVLGPPGWSSQWDFWFVEVLVIVLLALAAFLAVPWVDRAERRFPFAFASGLVALGLVWRFGLTDVDLLHTMPVFWLFALGWAAARATTSRHRAVVSLVALAAVPGYFDDPLRDGVILGGVVALVWLPGVRCPRWLGRAAGVLASAALYVYLTHWQVYPHLEHVSPPLAVLASLAVGIAYWQLSARTPGWVRGWVRCWVRGWVTDPGRPSASPAPPG